MTIPSISFQDCSASSADCGLPPSCANMVSSPKPGRVQATTSTFLFKKKASNGLAMASNLIAIKGVTALTAILAS